LQLRALLGEAGIDTDGLLSVQGRVTATKTRVLAQEPLRFPQQMARIDHLDRTELAPMDERRLLAMLTRTVPEVDAVLCSDYRLGLFTPTLAGRIRELCKRHGVLQTVDAQGGAELFADVDLFRCNAIEAGALLGHPLRDEDDFAQALPKIQRRLDVRAVIVTRGPDGLSLLGDDTPYTALPASNRSEVFDTTGAGDTFIAVATLALSAGATLLTAARLANSAAGLVVRRLGNAVVGLDEIVAAL
jgi:D-glycero-beta-D-manno-heptose-7-phosphate kinase